MSLASSFAPLSLRHRRLRWVAVGLALSAVPLAGCGSDAESAEPLDTVGDTTAAPASGADAELAAYCEFVDGLNHDGPTLDNIEEYRSLAPAEVSDALNTFADAFVAAEGDFGKIMGNQDNQAALGQISQFESEYCFTDAEAQQQTAPDPNATAVEFDLVDYEFVGDFPTTTGAYAFTFHNSGDEPHLVIMARLEDGVSAEQALAGDGTEGIAESFETNTVPPGADDAINVDLTPGHWVIVCPVNTADGHPHYELGMVRDFVIE